MLSANGPAKKSGKIVTTLMRSVTLFFLVRLFVEQSDLVVDHDGSCLEIRPNHQLPAIGNENAAAWSGDVEHHPLRELVEVRHAPETLTSTTLDAQPDEIVHVNLVFFQRWQLAERRQQITTTPELSAVSISQLGKLDDQSLLERLGRDDGEGARSFLAPDVVRGGEIPV